MKVQGKSFAIGVAFTIAVIAIFAFPYRNEIAWAVKNRSSLGAAADLGGGLKDIYGAFK